MKRMLTNGLVLMLLAAGAGPARADGPLRVDITDGENAPILLAVPTVRAGRMLAGGTTDPGELLASIIRSDLGGTGVYRLLDSPRSDLAGDAPDLAPWREQGAQVLVWGRVLTFDQAALTYECSYHDVFSGQREGGIVITVALRDVRRAAHRCADFAFRQTTGDPGYFDTQIAYVRRSNAGGTPVSRVALMDFDGAMSRDLSNGQMPVTFPAISPDARRVAFIAYNANQPQLVVHQLGTAQFQTVALPAGEPFSPSFVPNSRDLILALARDGDSDIFRVNPESGEVRQLTASPGSDVAPAASPEGSQIVFESDRSGQQQLYVMDADGSNQRRLTFVEGARFASPAWSPKGDRIAFTRIGRDGMRIGVMQRDGSDIRIIPGSGQDDHPGWAASGRALVFMRSGVAGGEPEIWRTDLSGRRQVKVSMAEGAAYPSWSGARP